MNGGFSHCTNVNVLHWQNMTAKQWAFMRRIKQFSDRTCRPNPSISMDNAETTSIILPSILVQDLILIENFCWTGYYNYNSCNISRKNQSILLFMQSQCIITIYIVTKRIDAKLRAKHLYFTCSALKCTPCILHSLSIYDNLTTIECILGFYYFYFKQIQGSEKINVIKCFLFPSGDGLNEKRALLPKYSNKHTETFRARRKSLRKCYERIVFVRVSLILERCWEELVQFHMHIWRCWWIR